MQNLIHHCKSADYDTAVRAWAIHDEQAREIVGEADKIRLDFIRSQFEKIGFKGSDLEHLQPVQSHELSFSLFGLYQAQHYAVLPLVIDNGFIYYTYKWICPFNYRY